MKNSWQAPALTVYGEVETLTMTKKRSKVLGKNDGILFTIPGLTPPGGVPIGS